MKWFKHDSDASLDAKLIKLRIKHGMEGYGLYWYCLEQIARNVDKHNLTFELEHDSEVIAHDTGIHFERVQEVMQDMVKLGLFENQDGMITCIKMAIRLDDTTSRHPEIKKLQDSLRRNSEDSPKKLRSSFGQNRTEQNRTESNMSKSDDSDFDDFWKLYPRKENKKKTKAPWKRLSKAKKEIALNHLKTNPYKGKEKQFIPLPTTYLNGERWEDEVDEPIDAKAKRLGITPRPGETQKQYEDRIRAA